MKKLVKISLFGVILGLAACNPYEKLVDAGLRDQARKPDTVTTDSSSTTFIAGTTTTATTTTK